MNISKESKPGSFSMNMTTSMEFCFIDRISPLRKKLLKGKLNDITKCKVDVHYKIKVIK